MTILISIFKWFVETTVGRVSLGITVALAWLFLVHDPKVADRARAGYVTIVEREKLQAKYDELERQNKALQQANNEFNKKLVLVQAAERAATEQLARENADHEAAEDQKPGGNRMRVTDPDYLRWLLR